MDNIRFRRTANDVYETEFVFEGEQEFEDRFKNCTKNPGHVNFIPVTTLELNHFPAEYRYPSLLALTQCLRDVTIRLTSNQVSSERPATFPGDNFEYPFSNPKYYGCTRCASGRIRFVNEYTYYDDMTCPCGDCKKSSDPKKKWWMVGVVTATHVVFNDEEAVCTTCSVGFNTKEGKFETLDGYGIAARGAFLEEDRSNVMFCTHDDELAGRLAEYVAAYKNITESVVQEFIDVPEDKKHLNIIVSHPHGIFKHVTIGTMHEKENSEFGFTKYTYSTDTCKGSSGAPVYIMDRTKLPSCNHPHSAAKEEINVSGGGY